MSAVAPSALGPLEAWINLKQTISAMQRCAEGSLMPHGLTAPQFDVLIALSDREVRSGCELPKLAERLGIGEAALKRVAARLRDHGAAQVTGAGANSLLKLTPKGLELRTTLRTRYESMLREGLLVVATQAATGYFWSTSRGK